MSLHQTLELKKKRPEGRFFMYLNKLDIDLIQDFCGLKLQSRF